MLIKSLILATTQEKAQLPGTDRDNAARELTPRSFAYEPNFFRFLLSTGGEAFGHGGITSSECKTLIARWNSENPMNQLKFDRSAFDRMARRGGQPDAVNRDEVFMSLGLSKEDREFDRSQPFLKFLQTNARGAMQNGGITFEEMERCAESWNKMNQSNPELWVRVTRQAFHRIALRDDSKDPHRRVTVSQRELDFFTGREVPESLPIAHQLDIKTGNLARWRSVWPGHLPFTYEAVQESVDNRYQGVRLKSGKVMPMDEVMHIIGRELAVSTLRTDVTQSDLEKRQEDASNPNTERERHYSERVRDNARLDRIIEDAVAAEERRRGRPFTTQERSHFVRGLENDRMIRELANIPGQTYARWTGLSEAEAPYAYAALRFVGNMLAAPQAAVKQAELASSDPSLYLRDVVLNAPKNAAHMLESLNALQPRISGPERFERSLNALALIIGGLKGTGLGGRNVPAVISELRSMPVTMAERRVLNAWIEHGTLLLKSDTSPLGVMNQAHIQRQIEVLNRPESRDWFRRNRENGFNWEEAKAAIVGTDQTKFNPQLTQQAIEGAQGNPLLAPTQYVPSFLNPSGGPLHNLYAHSQGGAAFTFQELVRIGREKGLSQGNAENLALRTALHITGHDSFNSGFGGNALKQILGGQTGRAPGEFAYPRSLTPSGFIVQAIDRIEATLPETVSRYVNEGVRIRGNSITDSIRSGIIQNRNWTKENLDGLLADARATLKPQQYSALVQSPFIRELSSGINNLDKITKLFRLEDGFYHLKKGNQWIKIDSLDTFEAHFLEAIRLMPR